MGREQDEHPCCGACAHVGAQDETSPGARRHLVFARDDAGAPVDAVLEVEGGPSFPLRRQRVVVGRAAVADVVLQDSRLSRQQFELVFGPDAVVIRDLGSSCGTVVNAQRIGGRRALCEGDRILVADFTLRLKRA